MVHDLVRKKKTTDKLLANVISSWLEILDVPFRNSLWWKWFFVHIWKEISEIQCFPREDSIVCFFLYQRGRIKKYIKPRFPGGRWSTMLSPGLYLGEGSFSCQGCFSSRGRRVAEIASSMACTGSVITIQQQLLGDVLSLICIILMVWDANRLLYQWYRLTIDVH